VRRTGYGGGAAAHCGGPIVATQLRSSG
jgi:hypothetical protein